MRTVRLFLSAGLLALGLVVAGRRLGPLPALGSFLDPWNGVWALGRASEWPAAAAAAVPGLGSAVEVAYDRRAVPHIFAATPEDAYRALGFVVARDRLFQLELQTRATAGTLSELLGDMTLRADRESRRLGMAWSADRAWAALDSSSAEARAVRAYAEGVNAWIATMPAAALPVEYRLFGTRPMHWEPVHSLYLLRRMGRTLAYSGQEWTLERVARAVGRDAADALFPVEHPIQEPIQPARGPYPRFDLRRLPSPAPSEAPADHPAATPRKVAALPDTAPPSLESTDGIGSNNWAVSPGRSATGHALLAGDPHLELTLPSIWYEVHLVVPGQLDAYGVTIPGIPGIVIGFNRDVAWSFTNTGADVTDFYVETVNHEEGPTHYLVDGEWRPVESRIEEFRGPDGTLLATDTLYATHRGPLARRDDGRWASMRWLVLEEGSASPLLAALRATSADEWLEAMTQWRVPSQNMVVADRGGTIALRSTGAFPLRPGNGLGQTPRHGNRSASDWTGFWPVSREPMVRNPPQGYVASANQQPKDPRQDPGYLDGDWPPPWRAMQINALLRDDRSVTVDEMRQFQTDPGSRRADLFVAEILAAGRDAMTGGTNGDDRDDLGAALALLAEWDRRYTKENERAVLFELTMGELERRAWDELDVPDATGATERAGRPGETVLLELLRDPASVWWDDRGTAAVVERRADIVAASLVAALRRARDRYGPPESGGWRWSAVHHANIFHFLRIPAFSALDLPVQGGPNTLNPSSGMGTHGPSWRMVVELGPEITAYGTYPGGQSGNPMSRHYDDRIPSWVNGELDTLIVPRSAAELPAERVMARLSLTPPGGPQ